MAGMVVLALKSSTFLFYVVINVPLLHACGVYLPFGSVSVKIRVRIDPSE
jgi:hypothetical protein